MATRDTCRVHRPQHVLQLLHTAGNAVCRCQPACQETQGKTTAEAALCRNSTDETHSQSSIKAYIFLGQEFSCFSYDENHEFRPDDSSLKYYYPPQLGVDLSLGFNTFVKQDDSQDEHLDSLLKAIVSHEKETGAKIDANIVTWRGMMTKVQDFIHPTPGRHPQNSSSI